MVWASVGALFFHYIFVALWLTLVAYWVATAWGNKRTVYRTNSAWRLLALAAIVALGIGIKSYPEIFRVRLVRPSLPAAWAGVAICTAGIGYAIWARHTLGKNWSGNPTIKEGHELIEAGPYRYVRHPIYTGILLGIVGTGIARARVEDIAIFALAAVTLWIKLRIEESLMRGQFPKEYPEYMRRTKALIPFVL